MSEPTLQVDGLGVGFDGDDGFTPVLEDVSFTLQAGRTLALVGESGCAHKLTVLPAIPGRVPAPDERGAGCPFHPRCDLACEVCRSDRPDLVAITPGHVAACHEIARA